MLSDEEAGRLMKAVWDYTMTGQQTELHGVEKGIFAMIQMTLKQDEKHDQEISMKRSKATESIRRRRPAEVCHNELITNDSKNNQLISIDDNKNKSKNKNKNKSKSKSKEKVQEKESLFERFWRAYPKKVAKQVAMRSFEKIDPDEALTEIMIAAIGKWKMTDQWNEAGGQFIPHPSTWLNQRRWEDELPKAGTAKGSVIAQQYEQRDYSGVQAELMAEQDREMSEYLGGFHTQGCRPFSAENEHTGSFSGCGEPPQAPFGEKFLETDGKNI